MNHGIGHLYQPPVICIRQPELLRRQISPKNVDPSLKMILKFWKIQVQLQSPPQAHFRLMRVFGAHQNIQMVLVVLQQVGRNVRSNIPRSASQKYRHVAPFSLIILEVVPSRAL